MSDLRVVISGTGKMGTVIADAVEAAEGLEAVGFVDGLASRAEMNGLPVYRDVAACIADCQPDVFIDFTNAAWTPTLVDAALAAKVRLVIGTTGLPNEWVEALKSRTAEAKVGCVFASNYALGAVLMMQFAKTAARWFDAAEIIELHHDQKVDSPSGTAKTTAELMRGARDRDFSHRDSEKEPLVGARGAEFGGVAIHSVRLPGFMASQEVIFGSQGQTLTIRHDSTRESYIPGIILATREVMKLESMVVGLDVLLGLG